MKIFKFIKRYAKFKKVLAELDKLYRTSNVNKLKYERASANNKSSVVAYQRKKAEYFKGQSDAYGKAVELINIFINSGKIIEIKDTETDKFS